MQTTNILNATIVNNIALENGGGVYVEPRGAGRALTIRNSIIAKNTSRQGYDCWGIVNMLDHSLIGSSGGCTISSGSANLLNQNPLISTSPVGLYSYYFALQSGSPAINTGANCLPTDQRGLARPQGTACDMGSYEY